MGRSIYAQNCIQCHGKDGGPAKARWTGQEPFKRGGEATEIYETLTKGFSAMPSFSYLPSRSRWALSYYIRSLNAKNPEHRHVR
jgi:mono/diheme cytochrome c family protein